MQNEFSRTELLLGKKAMETLAKSYVTVFGIGGVGACVVEGLARCGVGKFMLVETKSPSFCYGHLELSE